MPAIELSAETISFMLAHNAETISRLQAEVNELSAECDQFAAEWQESCTEVRNLRALNSSLLREVQAHRRALADIRQRIVNGETLTVSLIKPIPPTESSAEIIEETFNRR